MLTKQAIVETLIECGAQTAFTLPGLGITWTLDEFHKRRKDIRVVLTRSEQIASVMAQVTGRLTGRPGLFMGQGPFASTTGAFGILEAHFAGSPMVVLTETSDYDGFGQYGVYQTMTGDYGGADIRQMLGSITKYCTYATEPQDAVYGIQMAFKHAALPRKGPAAVILKTPIIRREMPEAPRARIFPSAGYFAHAPARPDASAMARLGDLLDAARFPVIVAGNGVAAAGAGAKLARLAEASGAAVATSYNAKGVVAEDRPYSVGMLGTWGMACANRALEAADCVIVLGASLGPDYLRFRDAKLIRPGEQKLAQVDVDPRNAAWVYPMDLAVQGDCGDAIDQLLARAWDPARAAVRRGKVAEVQKATDYGIVARHTAAPGSVSLSDVVQAFDRFLTPGDLLTLDAGSNRIWATSQLRVRTPGQLIVPGGIGGMGWGAPAAAAAKLVHPEKRVTCLAGDGGFMMTLPVLATCVQNDLPLVVVVANNSGLGMVRDNLKASRIAVDFAEIDFARIAEGLGCKGMRVNAPGQLGDALEEAHRSGAPCVIDAKVDPESSHVPVSHY
ncbi:MAG: thiamine pyrophosphate-binding protein [Alphaproteobacteria bacterium]|nr:thiamine pyrophosphate-binding protein [Alphaproteobacteria bacterium]